MLKLSFSVFAVCFITVTGLAQTLPLPPPPPCGLPHLPANVICWDQKSGKLLHTDAPPLIPIIPRAPMPPVDTKPVTIPKFKPYVPPPVHKTEIPPPNWNEPPEPQDSTTVNSEGWSYQGNTSCYHDGGTLQCFSTGALQSYATSQAEFEASFQAGEAVGGTIGLLIRAWIAHHHRIVQERKNIRQQIRAYYSASFDQNDEVMQDQDTLVADFTRLAQLDPRRRDIYEQGVKNATAIKANLAAFRPTTERNLRGIMAAKNLKYLRQNLGVAKKFYNLTENAAEKEGVYSQLIHGLAGYYEHQQNFTAASVGSATGQR